MHPVAIVLGAGWAAFSFYWLAAAIRTKRGHVPWARQLRIRAVLLVVVIVLVRAGVFRARSVDTDPLRTAAGVAVFAAGLTLAAWARVHIGRNWGLPMTQKDDPELVTSGPYRLVRHPIYSGLLVAGLGTAVALSWLWLIGVGAYYMRFSPETRVDRGLRPRRGPLCRAPNRSAARPVQRTGVWGGACDRPPVGHGASAGGCRPHGGSPIGRSPATSSRSDQSRSSTSSSLGANNSSYNCSWR